MTNKEMREIFDAVDKTETIVAKEAKKQFAADLKARIEIVTQGRPYIRLYPKEVLGFIDETLNPK